MEFEVYGGLNLKVKTYLPGSRCKLLSVLSRSAVIKVSGNWWKIYCDIEIFIAQLQIIISLTTEAKSKEWLFNRNRSLCKNRTVSQSRHRKGNNNKEVVITITFIAIKTAISS